MIALISIGPVFAPFLSERIWRYPSPLSKDLHVSGYVGYGMSTARYLSSAYFHQDRVVRRPSYWQRRDMFLMMSLIDEVVYLDSVPPYCVSTADQYSTLIQHPIWAMDIISVQNSGDLHTEKHQTVLCRLSIKNVTPPAQPRSHSSHCF